LLSCRATNQRLCVLDLKSAPSYLLHSAWMEASRQMSCHYQSPFLYAWELTHLLRVRRSSTVALGAILYVRRPREYLKCSRLKKEKSKIFRGITAFKKDNTSLYILSNSRTMTCTGIRGTVPTFALSLNSSLSKFPLDSIFLIQSS